MKTPFDESTDSDDDFPPPKKVKLFKPPGVKEFVESVSLPESLDSQPPLDDTRCIEADGKSSYDPNTSKDDFLTMNIESDEEILKETKPLEVSKKNSLSKSILNEDSVGFKMMKLMGFKSNSGLGVENNPNAIKEPVRVTKRKSRIGIGSKKVQPVVLQPVTSESTKQYHDSSREALEERQKLATISKLQRFCYEESKDNTDLQDEESIDVHPLWREYVIKAYGIDLPDSDPENDQASLSTNEKLQGLLEYSRSRFFYCTYCGVRYANEDELLSQCPGISHDLHLY